MTTAKASTAELCNLIDVFAAPGEYKAQLAELQAAVVKAGEELEKQKKDLARARERTNDLNARDVQLKYNERLIEEKLERATKSESVAYEIERVALKMKSEADIREQQTEQLKNVVSKEKASLARERVELKKEKEVLIIKSNKLDKTKARLVEALKF